MGILRFRIDRRTAPSLPTAQRHHNAITKRIKLLGRIDMLEKRQHQDGRIKMLTEEGEEIELRLSTIRTTLGEKLLC